MKNIDANFGRFILALAMICVPFRAISAGPIISEIMTDNVSDLVDEDGDFPDWIEIFNPDDQPVNLLNWSLTDSKVDPTKWLFPEITLAPHRFLVVFASGKNRTSPDAPLHTSFRLSAPGSYLALHGPGGTPIASQFDPQYPPQSEGTSYGTGMEYHSQVLVTAGAAVRFLVPTDAALKLTWTEKDFDASSWTSGTLGIGYDAKATPTYKDLIGTDVQTLMQGINPSIYMRITFKVDDLAALSGLILRMKYEDGFVAYLNGKEVGRKNVPTTTSWNSRAQSRRLEKDALVFQDLDLSSHVDLLVAGDNVLAIQGSNEVVAGAAFLMLPQLEGLVVDRVLEGDRRYFPLSTSWRPNDAGVPGVTSTPIFSPPGGAYLDPVDLEMTGEFPETVIHYTIDGTQPTESSPAYSGVINLAKTTVVRARAYSPGLAPSPTVTQVFIAMDATMKSFSSNLPFIVINTFGKTIPQDPKVPVYLSNFYVYEGRSSIQNPSDVDTQAGIKQRGSSSLQFPKASYTVELWDGNGLDHALPMHGLPRESDWVLYAPFTDKTLMRDVLAYEWSNWIGRWAPHTRFVEVFLSTSTGKLNYANYQGVYVFEERIKQGKDRVDIERVYRSQSAEPEISGGYILKKDRLDPGDSGMQTTRSASLGLNQFLAYVNPKEHDPSPTKHLEITSPQRQWIKGFLDQFETALYGANFKDPVNGYAKYIDVDAFIDHHLMTELCKNIDGYRLSTFMFKDRNGKLNMGPLWDYNLSLGNADYLNGFDPTGWYYTQVSETDYPWWRQLFLDPAFYPGRYTDKWFEYRHDKFTLDRMLASIDEKAAYLEEAQVRNYKRWNILGTYVWPNPQPIPKTYAEEISVMKSWLTRRLSWMDAQFITPPAFSQKAGMVAPGTAISLTATQGTIYYTVDLTDPRAANDGLGASAIEYTDPVVIDKNTRIRTRVRVEGVWSSLAEATYVTVVPPLAITEIMYRPAPPPAGSAYTALDLDFLEIENIGTTDYDLTGVQLTDSARFNFTNGSVKTIPAGGHVLVVKKLAAFTSVYGSVGLSVAGEYQGSLSDVRGTVGLKGPLDEQVMRFVYESTWYPETAGGGYSLVVVDSKAPRENWGKPENWRRSANIGGSPGVTDPEPPLAGLRVAGDVNQDGKLGLFDALGLLHVVFVADPFPLPCGDAPTDTGNKALLDVNGDSTVDQSDVVYLLNYLFLKGDPPALGKGCVRIAGCSDSCVP